MTHEPSRSTVDLDPELAHQFRSMINAVLLTVDLMEIGTPDVRKQGSEVIRRNMRALSDLIDQAAGTIRSRPSPDIAPKGLPRPGTKVLVVEDEYLLAQTVADTLRRARCEVEGPCATVEDALQLLPGAALDCAIVDANLDGVFSTPVVQALAARGVPVAILSGYDQAAIPPALQQLPFLQKPLHAPDLLRTVRAMTASAVGAAGDAWMR